MRGMHGVPLVDLQGPSPEAVALMVQMQQWLEQQDRQITEHQELLQRKDREIALREELKAKFNERHARAPLAPSSRSGNYSKPGT